MKSIEDKLLAMWATARDQDEVSWLTSGYGTMYHDMVLWGSAIELEAYYNISMTWSLSYLLMVMVIALSKEKYICKL